MIYFRFIGRLGNQMFQYACANELAEKYNTLAFWDDVDRNSFFKYFKKTNRRHIVANNRLMRKALRLFMASYYKNPIPVITQSGDEKIGAMKESFSNPGIYEGFFQSESYFSETKGRISEYFNLKKCYIRKFDNKYGELYRCKKILAIHCRLSDYVNWELPGLGGKNLSLPMSYYHNAIEHVHDITDYHIIVVTDDIDEAKKQFSNFHNTQIISDEEIIDFQIMMNADKLIISNSSFSWWAAYLNNKSPVIYAPEFWIGFKVKKEWPVQIIPDKFTKIPVY